LQSKEQSPRTDEWLKIAAVARGDETKEERKEGPLTPGPFEQWGTARGARMYGYDPPLRAQVAQLFITLCIFG